MAYKLYLADLLRMKPRVPSYRKIIAEASNAPAMP